MRFLYVFFLILFCQFSVHAAATIEIFTATNTTVILGNSTVLSWSVSGASEVMLYKEESGAKALIGKFSPTATRSVKPRLPMQYVLEVSVAGSPTVKKSLWVGVLTAKDIEAVNSGDSWSYCSDEGKQCTLPNYETYEVLYGANFTSNFRVKVYSSRQQVGCGSLSFGGDPAIGMAKSCYYRKVQGPTAATPSIDVTKIPGPGHPGRPDQILVPERVPPKSASAGAFRTHCEFSHMNFDDPIVAPGISGGGKHLHMFFGNTLTNFNSTPDSITTSGSSTCDGGILNATAYWMPAIIDTTIKTPLVPASDSRGRDTIWYYKSAGADPASVKTMPKGLKMIAGHPSSRWPQDIVNFSCKKPDGTTVDSDHMPRNCLAGDHLTIQIKFPRCWDGKNLDSPDHRSHMAYDLKGNVCPSSHPVVLPEVALQIRYSVYTTNTARWRVASDSYTTNSPGGYSMHADWMNGWNQSTLDTMVSNIINKSLDGGVNNLGNGFQLGSVLSD